jgi:hypothetical protein
MGNPKYPGLAAALGRIQEESGVELRHDGHHAVSADRVGGFRLVGVEIWSGLDYPRIPVLAGAF